MVKEVSEKAWDNVSAPSHGFEQNTNHMENEEGYGGEYGKENSIYM